MPWRGEVGGRSVTKGVGREVIDGGGRGGELGQRHDNDQERLQPARERRMAAGDEGRVTRVRVRMRVAYILHLRLSIHMMGDDLMQWLGGAGSGECRAFVGPDPFSGCDRAGPLCRGCGQCLIRPPCRAGPRHDPVRAGPF
jgi:hypothetical protein